MQLRAENRNGCLCASSHPNSLVLLLCRRAEALADPQLPAGASDWPLPHRTVRVITDFAVRKAKWKMRMRIAVDLIGRIDQPALGRVNFDALALRSDKLVFNALQITPVMDGFAIVTPDR